MRRILAVVAVLAAALPGRAANPKDGPPPGSSDLLRSQAATYATQLMAVIKHIDDSYVRKMPTAALLEAALAGIYEAAREPFPAGVKADLAQANDRNAFRHIVATARERLGDIEALRDQRALMASLRSLPRALDPFSGLPNPADRRVYSQDSFEGVGLEFEATPENVQQFDAEQMPRPHAGSRHRGPARIAVVMPGSPAQRAGLRPGDTLTHINDRPLEDPEGARLFPQLYSQAMDPQHRLALTLQRPGKSSPLRIELLPTQFVCESVFGVRRRVDNDWDFQLDREHRIGYLRLGFIDAASADEMEDAIGQLRASGMKALVFDLRGCPGGFVDPAKAISGMFVRKKLIATISSRNKPEQRYEIDNGTGVLEGIPTIVLIDEETRGGGEMIAAVLQDHGVARVAGRRSFGKGSVQTTEPIANLDGVTFKLTTGSFTRPSGKNLQRFPDSRENDDWGIRPDKGLDFPITPDLAKQVKIWMEEMALRPGDSRDPLPLDDPANDPLRDLARRELIKVLEKK